MNRFVILGVAIFFAVVGMALIGGEKQASAFGCRCCRCSCACSCKCSCRCHRRCRCSCSCSCAPVVECCPAPACPTCVAG